MKIYKDSKELPFLIYKKIMQTGDFLYMIKGYEEGDEVEADPKEMEENFNALITDFALSCDSGSAEFDDKVNHSITVLEFNKLTVAYNIIDHLILAYEALQIHNVEDLFEINQIINELLEGIKIDKSGDLYAIQKKVSEKIAVYESNILKFEEIFAKIDNEEDKQSSDLDKQFINICLILEIPFPDESKLSLYQFSILIEKAIEKAKLFEKLNSKS